MSNHFQVAKKIISRLQKEGHTSYIAGGWVRDLLMQHPSDDIDIATSASPEEIINLFKKTIEVGIAFGVVIVIEEGHQFEISTFRKDIESHGRKPEKIVHSSPEEDARRRDFTINGLFYNPLNNEVLDFIGGKEDLEHGIIRTIGNPTERFYEDRLRMIRAIRFATRFNYKIEPETEKAIIKHANTLFPHVAVERIYNEMEKIAQYPGIETALFEMHRLKLLGAIFPQLQNITDEELKNKIKAIPYFPNNCPVILHLMELFNDGLNKKLEICRYLKVGGNEMRLVEFVEQGKNLIKKSKEEKVSLTEWTHFYAHPQAQLCLDVIAAHYSGEAHTAFLQEHSERMEWLQPHAQRIAKKTPLVSGKMLQENGIAPGKVMGILMKEAEYIAITHDLHQPEPILELLKKSPNWPHK